MQPLPYMKSGLAALITAVLLAGATAAHAGVVGMSTGTASGASGQPAGAASAASGQSAGAASGQSAGAASGQSAGAASAATGQPARGASSGADVAPNLTSPPADQSAASTTTDQSMGSTTTAQSTASTTTDPVSQPASPSDAVGDPTQAATDGSAPGVPAGQQAAPSSVDTANVDGGSAQQASPVASGPPSSPVASGPPASPVASGPPSSPVASGQAGAPDQGSGAAESNTTSQEVWQVQLSGCTVDCQGLNQAQSALQQNNTVQIGAGSAGPATGDSLSSESTITQLQLSCVWQCLGTTTTQATLPGSVGEAIAQGVLLALTGPGLLTQQPTSAVEQSLLLSLAGTGLPDQQATTAAEQNLVDQTAYQWEMGLDNTGTQARSAAQTNTTVQVLASSLTAALQSTVSSPGPAAGGGLNRTQQGIWQLQIGCLIFCAQTQQAQQAAQSSTTTQVLTGSGSETTPLASDSTTQLIWQLQVGCLLWCVDATEQQSASQSAVTAIIFAGSSTSIQSPTLPSGTTGAQPPTGPSDTAGAQPPTGPSDITGPQPSSGPSDISGTQSPAAPPSDPGTRSPSAAPDAPAHRAPAGAIAAPRLADHDPPTGSATRGDAIASTPVHPSSRSRPAPVAAGQSVGTISVPVAVPFGPASSAETPVPVAQSAQSRSAGAPLSQALGLSARRASDAGSPLTVRPARVSGLPLPIRLGARGGLPGRGTLGGRGGVSALVLAIAWAAIIALAALGELRRRRRVTLP